MEKIKIITFQFAHNYGAMLQCYSLKQYLENKSYKVCIDKYVPQAVIGTYSLKPQIMIKHPRATINEILRSVRRRKQYRVFNSFINELCNQEFNPEIVIIGSDQVWNEEITGKISYYYGTEFSNTKKISYAGSFGNDQLSLFQTQMVEKYFNEFYKISIREKINKEQIEKICDKNVDCVLDPVFLLGIENWDEFSEKPKSLKDNSDFILYYALRYDKDLIDYIKSLSKKMNCKVISVHPTCINMDKEFIHLNDVGPREFVYLIKNSRIVGTNSFHAMAFSAIYKKNAVYKAYSENESRIPELLDNFNVKCNKMKTTEYDFSSFNYELLNEKIENSKKFLKESLQ